MKKYSIISVLSLSLLILSLSACNNSSDSNSLDKNENVASISSKNTKYDIETQLGEKLDPNEEQGTQSIEKDFIETLKNQTTTSLTRRAVHAKHHGIVKATFKINNQNIDPKYRVGVFAENNKEFNCWIRFSNGNGNPKPDTEGDVRGMAIKLMGVPGKKLLDAESDATTQDFLMMNSKTFFVKSLDDYVQLTRALKDGFGGLAKFAVTHPKTVYNIYKIFNQKVSNPLDTAFYSTTPYKLGNSVIKFGAKPCSGEISGIPKNAGDDYLREAMTKTLSQRDACFDFVVQFRKGSLDDMPVEDATKEWNENVSPYIKVARINIPKQSFDSKKQMDFAENISYTPWHSLPEHKPLGFTNRVRRVVYNTISQIRHSQNGTVRKEPTDFTIN